MEEKERQPGEKRERLQIFVREISRRDLLKGAGAAGAALGLGGILAACGGGGGDEAAPAATTEAGGATSAAATTVAASAESGGPKTGGRLRIGHVGGGKGETFDPARGSTFIDASRYFNIYDPMIRINPDLTTAPGLVLEWNPNDDSTAWELKLRSDVVWHDGKDFTSDDLIYALRSMGDAKHVAHSAVSNLRLGELKAIDPLTVQMPLKTPDARPFDQFSGQNTVVIQDGAKDFSKPVGTGPFVFESFTVGERSLAKKNPDYWEEGKPYVDEWEDISIDDDAARLNALLAGEIDAMSQLQYAQAKAQEEQGQVGVVIAPSTSIHVILMAVDLAPFQDKRVRQAFRMIPNRQAMIDAALAGYGTVANDLPGKGLPYFADGLPTRDQDLEQAKSLIKAAGAEGMNVTLHTSTIVPGFVEAATIFAQQAKEAGVNVEVKKEPANAYFDTSLLYTKLNFAQSYWTVTSLSQWYSQSLLSDAVWNETHWREPSFDELIKGAIGSTEEAAAAGLWKQAQQVQYDDGGYIVWTNVSIVDAISKGVQGMVPSSFFNLGGWNYRDLWLDA